MDRRGTLYILKIYLPIKIFTIYLMKRQSHSIILFVKKSELVLKVNFESRGLLLDCISFLDFLPFLFNNCVIFRI